MCAPFLSVFKLLCIVEDKSCPTFTVLVLVLLVAVEMDQHYSLHLVHPWDQGHDCATQPAEVRDREQSKITNKEWGWTPDSGLISSVLCMHAQSLQSCPTLCDPMDCGPPPVAPLPMGFSMQEHWSGLPFPPPGDLCLNGLGSQVTGSQ